MSSHPFDIAFALAEPFDATEADTHLTVGLQLQACPDGLVSATPAAWFRWLDQVATDGSHGHDRSLGRQASADSDRDWRYSAFLVVASMGERKHPPKHTQQRSLTPALGRTLALDCSHALDEATDDGEQQIRRPDSDQKPIHIAHATPSAAVRSSAPTLADARSLKPDSRQQPDRRVGLLLEQPRQLVVVDDAEVAGAMANVSSSSTSFRVYVGVGRPAAQRLDRRLLTIGGDHAGHERLLVGRQPSSVSALVLQEAWLRSTSGPGHGRPSLPTTWQRFELVTGCDRRGGGNGQWRVGSSPGLPLDGGGSRSSVIWCYRSRVPPFDNGPPSIGGHSAIHIGCH